MSYLRAMMREAERRGAEVTLLSVREMRVRPCVGCEKCRGNASCVLPPDDAHRFADFLRDTDALVIGSPCYWYNMSGALKVLLDRVVYAFIDETRSRLPRPLLRGKTALLVVSCTAPWPFNSLLGYTSGTLRALRHILSAGGVRVKGSLVRTSTQARPLFSPRDERRALRMIRRILPREGA